MPQMSLNELPDVADENDCSDCGQNAKPEVKAPKVTKRMRSNNYAVKPGQEMKKEKRFRAANCQCDIKCHQ